MSLNLSKAEKHKVLKSGLIAGIVATVLSAGAISYYPVVCALEISIFCPSPIQLVGIMTAILLIAGTIGAFAARKMKKDWQYVLVAAFVAAIITLITTAIAASFAMGYTTGAFIGFLIGFAIARKAVK